MTISERIVEKILTNRISTTEVADCLGKTGLIPNVKPANPGHHAAGEVFWAYAYNNGTWEIHEQLQNVPPGSIVIADSFNVQDRSLFGHLVTKYLVLYRRVKGVVVRGLVRDAHSIMKDNFPIWIEGYSPIGCFHKPNEYPVDPAIVDGFRIKYEGTIAVCDDGGVVLIDRDNINEEFLDKLDFIELQEDIWYFCLDTKKWSTYKTACEKIYLKDDMLLPEEYRDGLKRFQNG